MNVSELMIDDWVLHDGEPYQIRQLGIYGENRDGEDAIYVQAPCYGKCSWTYKEALESILNDTVLENTNENIIDSVLEYYEYLNKM